MSIEKDIRMDGKTHRAILRFATVTYWGNGLACGYNKADKAVVQSLVGFTEMAFAMPAEEGDLLQTLRLMGNSYTSGKKRAKEELRDWLNG